MKLPKQLLYALVFSVGPMMAAPGVIHPWEMQELTFTAENSYENLYTEVIVWVDLSKYQYEQNCCIKNLRL